MKNVGQALDQSTPTKPFKQSCLNTPERYQLGTTFIKDYNTSIGSHYLVQESGSPSETSTSGRSQSPPSARQATEGDAKRHKIPPGYSLKNWDPTEDPILLLGSVFDANSLGKWIYDWTVYHHGSGTPVSDMASELWLLLIQLSGKVKRAYETIERVRGADNREIIEDFIESGERLINKLRKLLKTCEAPMLKANKKGASLGKNAGVEFVETLFGRERELEKTERFMQGVRLFNLRFDHNCEDILRNTSGKINSATPHTGTSRKPTPEAPRTFSKACSLPSVDISASAPRGRKNEGSSGETPLSTDSLDTKSSLYSDQTQVGMLPTSHPFYIELDPLTSSAFSLFCKWKRAQYYKQAPVQEDAKYHCSTTGRPEKRRAENAPKKASDQETDDEDEAMDGNKRPRTALTRDVSMGRLSLACPYYKHDKIRHQACLKLELQRIRDVKQHLRRKHKQPHFCSTCGQEFDKLDEQRKHSRPQQCRMRNFAEPEGITEDQEKLLASKVDKKSTLADQWFSVWDIVFSGTPRPKSAYVNSLVCEVMSSLREFWRAKGKEIVSDHIRGKRGLSYSIEDEERALEMVYSSTEDGMLDAVIDRFVSVYDTSSSPGKTTADGSSSSAYGNPSLGTVITDESLPQLSDTQFEPKIDELTKPPLHDTLVNYDAETQPAAAGMTEDQFEAFLADFCFDASAGQDMLGGPPGADGPSTDPSF